MASKLERAIVAVKAVANPAQETKGSLDPRCLLVIVLLYLVAMLSVPAGALSMLLWFAAIPIVAAPLLGMSFGKVFVKSLVVVPFAAIIAIFNPIYNQTVLFVVHGIPVSRGWIEFISIILRGLLSVQAVIILIGSVGFVGMCRALGRMGMPGFMTTQLLLVYRYIGVLLEEALSMKRAREARSFGRKALPFREWGNFVGQLFLRSVNRSEKIHKAMQARGFRGSFPVMSLHSTAWTILDTVVLILCASIFVLLRMLNISALFGF